MQKKIVRLVVIVAALLLVPLVAMQFTEEVQWTAFDFAFMGALLFCSGLAFELVAARVGTLAHRIAVGIAVGATLLLIWVNAAVGMIGEDNPANALYLAVPLIGLAGIAATRLRPRGMMYTAYAMAAVQMLIPVVAFVAWRPDFSPGVFGVFALNAIFAAAFIASALFFRRDSPAA